VFILKGFAKASKSQNLSKKSEQFQHQAIPNVRPILHILKTFHIFLKISGEIVDNQISLSYNCVSQFDTGEEARVRIPKKIKGVLYSEDIA
jgi:hypothetical protein